ncbi:retrovirus-related pol polyprotein from transposon TNT 1-94, partial [Tanacetum coccineum]
MNWGEVNPTHAYYNGSCTSKDTEDPSCSTSFETRRTEKTSSALEALWKTLFYSANVRRTVVDFSHAPPNEYSPSPNDKKQCSLPVQTRRQLATDPEMCMFALTVSIVEPKNIKEAMADSAWIEAMQEELHQFDRLQVWELVDKPFGKNQRVMEVYVAQPDGFVDPDHPDKVYRLRKALYGLKQALRAWYDELSKFLMSKGFTKGIIDPTLFTIKYGEDILLVQIYVDDIIFGSTDPKLPQRAFSDVDHAGCIDTRKSTSGGIQ